MYYTCTWMTCVSEAGFLHALLGQELTFATWSLDPTSTCSIIFFVLEYIPPVSFKTDDSVPNRSNKVWQPATVRQLQIHYMPLHVRQGLALCSVFSPRE